jgi:hypothetical protein
MRKDELDPILEDLVREGMIRQAELERFPNGKPRQIIIMSNYN